MKLRRPPLYVVSLGLVAALALGGCGQGDSVASGGLRKPTPINVVNGAASGAAATGKADARIAGAESAAGGPAASMIAPAAVEFVLGEVGALPTNTTGYVFPAGAKVSADRVEKLAKALGVDGKVEPGAADSGLAWQVGPTDGSAPSLNVGSDAQLNWWYSGSFGDGREITACASVVSPDGTTSDDQAQPCPEPEPPANVPNAEEAEAKARKLMDAMGKDLSGWTFNATADEWSANVEVIAPLDGFESPVRWRFGFGENGALQYASGLLATPEGVGPYPLVGLDEAFARLQEQNAWGPALGGPAEFRGDLSVPPADDAAVASPPNAGAPETAVAEAPPVAKVGGAPTGQTTPGEAPDVEGRPDIAPQPVEPMTVTLTGVQADLWWAWDADGAVWLLPAYRFVGDDGGWYVVPAVTDEFLIETQDAVDVPRPLEPGVVEPGGGSSGSGEASGDSDGSQVSPGNPGSGGTPPTGFPPSQTVIDPTPLQASIGSSLADFTKAAEAIGATVRVTERDGESLPVTMDFSPNRVNVAVKGDKVTAILGVS